MATSGGLIPVEMLKKYGNLAYPLVHAMGRINIALWAAKMSVRLEKSFAILLKSTRHVEITTPILAWNGGHSQNVLLTTFVKNLAVA